MNCDNWMTIKVGDAFLFNPKESIPKGTIAKKIAMEKLQPFTRLISGYELEPFSGGSKFKNGDTLMARITPCLENGKTAQVSILKDGEVGFGSTEYIVFREIKDISDNNFIYYFVLNPCFRDIAVQSMVGSSGRQRVQQSVLENLEVQLPSLSEQKKIASILSSLDDKIELNNRINENLEQQAQAIFKSWFVDFEPFKDGEFVESELGLIPKGWKIGCLGDIATIFSGKRPPAQPRSNIIEMKIPIIGASNATGFTNASLNNEKILVTGRVGTLGIIQRINKPCWPSDNTLIIKSKFYEYVYNSLLNIKFDNLNIGSTQPLITQSDLKKIAIIIPEEKILMSFENIVMKHMNIVEINNNESCILAKIRNTLLPKLMSGEIEV